MLSVVETLLSNMDDTRGQGGGVEQSEGNTRACARTHACTQTKEALLFHGNKQSLKELTLCTVTLQA